MLADRAQLLAAAERAITAIGADVTMDQIAAEAQVTKPILYRTIGDRDSVIDALSDVLVDRILVAIAATQSVDQAPRAVFAAAVRAYLASVARHRDLYLFVHAAGQRTGPLRRRIDRSSAALIELLSASGAGIGSATSPVTWSHSIIGALQIVTLMWIESEDTGSGGPHRTLDGITDDVTHLLWPGVESILGAGGGADPDVRDRRPRRIDRPDDRGGVPGA